jgi:hypothetical protein
MVPINIRKPLKRFAPHFLEARKSGLNEADTIFRLCRFFEEVLGYDELNDISREAQLKHKYVDVCLKIDGRIRLLVEAKAADQQLRDRHIEQAQAYASQNNYRWVLLTNGVDWNLYHLTFEEGIEYERVFLVSLDKEEEIDDAATKLAVLHKHSIRDGELDRYWEKKTALGASSIGKALFGDSVLRLIRREIRRDTGILIDPEDLGRSIHEMLSTEAREQIGPMRVRKRRRATRRRAPTQEGAPSSEEEVTTIDESPQNEQNCS